MPDSVKNWLKDLCNLKGVPFNYLVPDEKMLPVESIRFFQMDEAWIQALLDGALSIGRISTRDHENDKVILAEESLLTTKQVKGFIMPSEVISGYPGIQVFGYKIKAC